MPTARPMLGIGFLIRIDDAVVVVCGVIVPSLWLLLLIEIEILQCFEQPSVTFCEHLCLRLGYKRRLCDFR